MNLIKTSEFLEGLMLNNNREWFRQNKDRYGESVAEFTDFLQRVIDALAAADPIIGSIRASDFMFRIYRDIRFSKKTPYKENFGAFISPCRGDKNSAGYYLHFEPGAHFVAGGRHLLSAAQATAIRHLIASRADEFLMIVEQADFKKIFSGLEGERLLRLPREFESAGDHLSDILILKTFTVMARVDDTTAESEDYACTVAEYFKVMTPLIRFLREV